MKKPVDYTSPAWETAFWAVTLAAAACTVIAAVCGLMSGFLGYKISDAVQRKAEAEIASAHQRAAEANQKAEEARLETIRLDPINLPITSIRVEIYLVLDYPKHPRMPTVQTHLKRSVGFFLVAEDASLGFWNQPLVILSGSRFEVDDAPYENPNNELITFDIDCQWPANDMLDLMLKDDHAHNWVQTQKASTADFNKRFRSGILFVRNLPPKLRVQSASCRLTINGTIQRNLKAVETTAEDIIVFLPE